jgi:cob(I)alamin adenosyltransferase
MAETKRYDGFIDRALSAIERGREELTKISRVGRLKLDLAQLQRDRRAVYRKLGEDTYKLLKEDRFAAADVESLLVRLDQANDQISKLEAQVLKASKTKAAEETPP